MKNYYLIPFLLSLAVIFSYSSSKDNQTYPIQEIEKNYLADYARFRIATIQFLNSLQDEKISNADLKKQYSKMRYYFKRIEFLWSFLDKEYVSKHINGAPLPKIETSAPGLLINQPAGLQCIDEALYEENIDKLALIELTEQLLSHLPIMKTETLLRDQQFLDASKLAIVRLAYVSSAGFDVPGSLQPFTDMIATLEALEDNFSTYQSFFSGKKNLLLQLEQLKNQLKLTKQFAAVDADFEKFDRVQFLRDYLNPLFASIVQFHKDSGFETYYETTQQKLGINLLATNLIDEQLLDKEFFFKFPKDVDSLGLLTLGRKLFYDPILSSDVSVSCASCHKPQLAFSDGLAKSITHKGRDTVGRNAPGLLNAVYAEKYFYDLRTENLINQIEHVIQNEKEMGANPLDIGSKLKHSSEYKLLFANTFGTDEIRYQFVALALASYVSSLTGFQSDVDKYLKKEINVISPDIYAGMNIFYGKGQCASCHFGPTYAGLVPPFYSESESEVLGVPNSSDKKKANIDGDLGRYANLKEQAAFNKYAFKTTSVRNVKYTSPYMHNGVFSTLEQVVDFYNDGGGNAWGFELNHQTLSSDSLGLNHIEKKQIIAFINALSNNLDKFKAPQSLPAFEEPYAKWNNRLSNK